MTPQHPKKRPGATFTRDVVYHLAHTDFTFLPPAVITKAIRAMVNEIADALGQGRDVHIEGLGTFTLRRGGVPKRVHVTPFRPNSEMKIVLTADRIVFLADPDLVKRHLEARKDSGV